MDKNTELLLHIFFLQRDHTVGLRTNQLTGILYSTLCELKLKNKAHEYSFTFKRGSSSPTSPELNELLKSLVFSKHLELARNLKNETVYKLGVKGALMGNKLPEIDSDTHNCLMGWMGYFLPLAGNQVDKILFERCKLSTLEIGDAIALFNPFSQKGTYSGYRGLTDYDDDWL